MFMWIIWNILNGKDKTECPFFVCVHCTVINIYIFSCICLHLFHRYEQEFIYPCACLIIKKENNNNNNIITTRKIRKGFLQGTI